MSFEDVLEKRRSIRKYLDKDVSEENIKKVIEAGILSPSAHNRQPWKVKILKNELKSEVYEALMLKKDINHTIEMTANIIQEAPVLLAVFYDKEEGTRDNDILSIGAFIENMHLKATSIGLGSLWIANTNHIKEEIKNICDTDLECVSCLALGYSDQDPKKRPRKDYNEIVIE